MKATKELTAIEFAGRRFEMTTEQIKTVVDRHYYLYWNAYSNMIGYPHPVKVDDVPRECFLDDALAKSSADSFHNNEFNPYENYLAILLRKLKRKERDGYYVKPLFEAVEALYEEECAAVRGFY